MRVSTAGGMPPPVSLTKAHVAKLMILQNLLPYPDII